MEFIVLSFLKEMTKGSAIKRFGFFIVILFVGAFSNVANADSNVAIQPTPKVEMVKNNQTISSQSVVVVKQKLKPLLEEFARQNDVTINISEKIRNIFVRSQRFSKDKMKFLSEISSEYAMDWYLRGEEYFISAEKERLSRMIGMENISVERLQAELALLAKNTNDFTIEEISSSNSIFVSGPPTYVALVELVVEGMIKNNKTSASGVSVVRYGKKTSSDIPSVQ